MDKSKSGSWVGGIDTSNNQIAKRLISRHVWSDKELSKLDSFEVKVPNRNGLCSDNNCPCKDTVIPQGNGFIFISEACANFRKDYRTSKSCENKLNELADHFSSQNKVYLPTEDTYTAVLVCRKRETI